MRRRFITAVKPMEDYILQVEFVSGSHVLLDMTKGYLAHEQSLFTQVIRLRKGMSIGELNQAEPQIEALSAKVLPWRRIIPRYMMEYILAMDQKAGGETHMHFDRSRNLCRRFAM